MAKGKRGKTPGLPDRQKRLRRFAVFFVLVLSIPGFLLAWHALGQLKWQTFHQYSQLAQAFTQEVDGQLNAFLLKQEAHSVSEFSFWTGTARSPLAALPDTEHAPLVGYFQIDEAGRVSSPLLPEASLTDFNASLTEAERKDRQRQFDKITQILQQNQLVQRRARLPAAPMVAPAPGDLAAPSESLSGMFDDISLDNAEADMAGAALEQEMVVSAEPELTSRVSKADNLQLFESYERNQIAEKKSANRLGKVKDLPLEEVYVQAPVAQAKKVESIKQKRESRKEQVAVINADELKSSLVESRQQAPVVRLFESEVEPFQLRLLDSGQWVLFRQVIREGKRWVQGAIYNAAPFLEEYVKQPFLAHVLSGSSRLIVAYQNDVVEAYSGHDGSRGYPLQRSDLSGQILYQAPLSAPFDRVRLIYSVQELPRSDSAPVLGYTLGAFLLMLMAGAFFMYRQGVGQLRLAQQQQDFVSAVSHELKTPLTSIRMYSEILQAGWADATKQKEYFGFIHDESERLTRLINNVLQLARFQRSELVLDLTQVTVTELMDLLRSRMQSRCDNSGFTLDIHVAPDIDHVAVTVDKDAMLQVMINLVDNAIKFSAQATEKHIEVRVEGAGSAVALSVRDHGPGIPKQDLKRIFDLFYRIENEMTRETIGTGIGLALVMQLVQGMGATIQAENMAEGARFTLLLPCADL